jgi:hypothetical protein
VDGKLELKKLIIENVPAPSAPKKRGRPAKATEPTITPSLPNNLVLGCLVRYYDGGWRFGYLESVKITTAHVTPVAAYKANPGRSVSVNVDELHREDR